jgi:hypothetical protein
LLVSNDPLDRGIHSKVLQKTVEEHLEREEERQSKRKDEDYDDEVEETLVDEDDEDVYVLSKVTDVMHALFLVYRWVSGSGGW